MPHAPDYKQWKTERFSVIGVDAFKTDVLRTNSGEKHAWTQDLSEVS